MSQKRGKKIDNKNRDTDTEVFGKRIQWYPGHMAKTKRKITESMSSVEIVVEILDARIPLSSQNPDLSNLIGSKPHIILLNKMDAANIIVTNAWIDFFKEKGIVALAVNCKSGKKLNMVMPTIRKILEEDIARWQKRGMVGRTIRMMIAGIPNSGKSSFINRMAKAGKAKVEDRPGITRENQWYLMEDGTQMLDTPGVLWPKFESQEVAKNLAFTGAIKDEILQTEEIATALLVVLISDYKEMIKTRYALGPKFDKVIEEFDSSDNQIMLVNPEMALAYEVLQMIGENRGMFVANREIDILRASNMVLDEFRSGKIGRISLEKPFK